MCIESICSLCCVCHCEIVCYFMFSFILNNLCTFYHCITVFHISHLVLKLMENTVLNP